jgi:hypothetical protein
MKTTLLIAAIAVLCNLPAQAADKTIKGDALCAKCELKEAKACQAAIRVKEGNKTVVYYADQNQVAKDFHDKICSATVPVKATGEVKEVDGKKHITLAKIEEVK